MADKLNVGFVGARGMVGSVLMERMHEEDDFDRISPVFLSTSQAGQDGPVINGEQTVLRDAFDIDALSELDVVVSCQGSDYTKQVHGPLREKGWKGFWIDAASHLRYEPDSTLILDPVNRDIIDQALAQGKKDFIGANCTVSTMLIGLGGLFKSGLVEYANPSTYQAVSGAGSKNMIELLRQMRSIGQVFEELDPAQSILEIDRQVSEHLRSQALPTSEFGYPIAGSILPWIDSEMPSGQSREEHKAQVETNLILGNETEEIIIDGTCVRVGSMRSHAQNITLKLNKDLPIEEIEQIIKDGNEWVDFVPNNKTDTLSRLTPAMTSGSLQVAVGRVRKLHFGPEYVNVLVVGDQLLWGAAEPLRRMLTIITAA